MSETTIKINNNTEGAAARVTILEKIYSYMGGTTVRTMTLGVFPVFVKAPYHISLSIGLIFVVTHEYRRNGIVKVKGSS